jgi:hypothetical protein
MKNEKALQEFMTRITEAKTLLDKLQTYVDNHMGYTPDEINWNHTGDAGRLLHQLTELSDWVFKTGEYAE